MQIQRLVLSVLTLTLPTISYAESVCEFWSKQPASAVRKQNDWAKNCGLIRASDADSLSNSWIALGYVIDWPDSLLMNNLPFYGGPANPGGYPAYCPPGTGPAGDPKLPHGVRLVTTCYRDCLASGGSLRFNGSEQSVSMASRGSMRTVTTLATTPTATDIRLAEQPIERFLATPFDQPVYVIRLNDGSVLELTGNHPVALADGQMVQAKDIQPTDALLRADGDVAAISAIEQRSYKGDVFTVKPRSLKKEENVLVTKGILNGSPHFTLRWATEASRLLRAETMDVRGL